MSSYGKKKKTPLPPTPGWAVYLRTSSEDHQKPELSRARQRSIIDGNVLQHSELPVIDEYVDVLTGKIPNRVGYQRLLADARVGKFSHVIVERADRFGRNDTEALRAIDELNDFGVAVRFANSPDLDPMDPDDRVLVALSFTLARRESALLGIRTRGGQQAKRKSGGCTNYAPDGYKNVTARTDVKRKWIWVVGINGSNSTQNAPLFGVWHGICCLRIDGRLMILPKSYMSLATAIVVVAPLSR
jgi:DNA invertase Pin-like site-specific DNA recombinase